MLCPVTLTRLYFKNFNLFFFSQGLNSNFINFRIKSKTSSIRIPNSKLSESNATKNTKKLLKIYNIDANKFTEKSLKIAGVTALLDSGEPLENVPIASRWKSTFNTLTLS